MYPINSRSVDRGSGIPNAGDPVQVKEEERNDFQDLKPCLGVGFEVAPSYKLVYLENSACLEKLEVPEHRVDFTH